MSFKLNKKIASSLIIGLAIASVGVFFKLAVDNFRAKERFVSVRGLAEREVLADKVIWPILYKEIGNDLSVLYSKLEAKNKAIIGYLKEKGIDENEISFGAPEIWDMHAERYNSNKPSYRYNVTNVIIVASSKVELVRELIASQSELLGRGVALVGDDYYGRYNVEYHFTKLNDIKPEMIEEATQNARLAAQKFAEDSKSVLGKIRTADQGLFSVQSRDEFSKHLKQIRVVTRIDYYLND